MSIIFYDPNTKVNADKLKILLSILINKDLINEKEFKRIYHIINLFEKLKIEIENRRLYIQMSIYNKYEANLDVLFDLLIQKEIIRLEEFNDFRDSIRTLNKLVEIE